MERYLRGPVFEPIGKDQALFEAVTVDEELAVVVWPNGADIDSAVLTSVILTVTAPQIRSLDPEEVLQARKRG